MADRPDEGLCCDRYLTLYSDTTDAHLEPSTASLIFDVEAIADGDLISRVRYPDEQLTPDEAIARYRAELIETRSDGKDFIPHTFMLPISVAVAKVSPKSELIDLKVLDAPEFRPHVITQHFWQGWRHYQRPTFVTFNGRGYDLPLMELAAYRYGLQLPDWFDSHSRSFEQPRNRYNTRAHLDIMDMISNFGASRMIGGLNLLANLLGKPGKTGIDGSKVQDMYFEGKAQEINDYCMCDVLDTYFVFLRCQVLLGKLTLEAEHDCVAQAKALLESRQGETPAFAHYLRHWGDWESPQE